MRWLCPFLLFAGVHSAEVTLEVTTQLREVPAFLLSLRNASGAVVPEVPAALRIGSAVVLRSGDTVPLEPGTYTARIRYGLKSAALPSLHVPPSARSPLTCHVSVEGPPRERAPQCIAFRTGSLPPPELGHAHWLTFLPLPSHLPRFSSTEPLSRGVYTAPAGVPFSELFAAYLSAVRQGTCATILLQGQGTLTPQGWSHSPAARFNLLPREKVPKEQLSRPGAFGLSEGPLVALGVGSSRPGDTITLRHPTEVRLTVWGASPSGITRLEVLEGERRIFSFFYPSPQREVRSRGETILTRPALLLAVCEDARGRRAATGIVSVVPESATPPGEAAARAPLGITPLTDTVSPAPRPLLSLVLASRRSVSGTLFCETDPPWHIVPAEFPLSLQQGDVLTVTPELLWGQEDRLSGTVRLRCRLKEDPLWEGTFLFCPWEPTQLKIEPGFSLVRRQGRVGCVVRSLKLRLRSTIRKARMAVCEVFSEGWAGAAVRLGVDRFPPRIPLAVTSPLPARRGWHTVTFDLGGAALPAGGRVTVDARSQGLVLLGGVRILKAAGAPGS